jgi:hypothetical protein
MKVAIPEMSRILRPNIEASGAAGAGDKRERMTHLGSSMDDFENLGENRG